MNAITSVPSAATFTPALLASNSLADVPNAEPERLAKQFESLFVSMLVKEMRQSSSLGEGLFPGDSSDTYGGMFDMFMGQHLAENGGIGLAETIGKSLQKSI